MQWKLLLYYVTYTLLSFVINTESQFVSRFLINEDEAMKRIIHGRVVDITDYPFQIALVQTNSFLDKKRIICGGSIVQPKVIFTAAHCTHVTDDEIRSDLTVLIGANSLNDPNGEEHTIDKIIKHPAFTFRAYDHDISVILLKESLEFNERIQSIPISVKDYRSGTKAVASGWGRTEFGQPSKYLRSTVLTIEDWDRCQDYFPKIFHPQITRNMICVKPSSQTTYYGDSGGPLTVDGKLVGLVSFGRPISDNKKTTVFTRVRNFLDFVEDVVPDFKY